MNLSPPTRAILAGALAVGVLATACGDDDGGQRDRADRRSGTTALEQPVIDPGDGGNYAPVVDPASFVDRIDNPYLPFLPGAKWVYEGTSGGEAERTEVVVTPERKLIQGISAVVVRDTVSVEGQVVEDTYDWFAQDREGTVWYLGEDVKDFENGKLVSRAGSWEHGVDGAVAGIVMPGSPRVGLAYRQEFYEGEAEDMAEIVRVDATADVPFGRFDRVVVTKDWNPLDPKVVERKQYAPGVGQIGGSKIAGGSEHLELVSYEPGS
jgi:hypothetical protein